MPISLPPTEKSLGRKVVVFLTTPPAAGSGIPTLAEVNAGLQASLHLYTPFNVTPTQNTGEGPRKLGSKFVPQENGVTTYPAVEIEYSYLPQELGTPGTAGNEVYEALEPGEQLTAVVLNGIDGDKDPLVAGDIADVYLVEAGVRRKGETGDGEFDQLSTKQNLVIVGGEPIVEDHALAA
jgi:hypothetical protein